MSGKIVHTQRNFIWQPTHRQTHHSKTVTSKYLTHPTALLTNPHSPNFTDLTTPSILSVVFQHSYNVENNSKNQWAAFISKYNTPYAIENILSRLLIIKPTRCTNFTNLFWNESLQVSDSSSVHHQEFIHSTLSNGICHTGL
jgi:hypothetical protein